MKQIILILLITTCFNTINAQDYRNFPTSSDNPLWVMKTTFPYFEDNDDVYCDYIGMIGDTMINSKDYSKIYYLSDTIVDVNNISYYYGAVREDSKRIFLILANEQKEKLIFDFNKEINDIILFDSLTIPPTPIILQNIDTLVLNESNYMRYSTTCGDKWIEGIGNTEWTIFGICPEPLDCGCYTRLCSFKRGELIVYGKNCTCDNATSISNTPLIDNIIIYPNPTNGLVSIDLKHFLTREVQITIYDYSGKLVHTKTAIISDKNIEMNVSFLQTGIYLFKIIGGGKSRSLKLIKE